MAKDKKIVKAIKKVYEYVDHTKYYPEIENIIHNPNPKSTPTRKVLPNTVVILSTGEKGIARLQPGDTWNPELGFWVAYAKALRNKRGRAISIANMVINKSIAEFAQRKRDMDTTSTLINRGEYFVPYSKGTTITFGGLVK